MLLSRIVPQISIIQFITYGNYLEILIVELIVQLLI